MLDFGLKSRASYGIWSVPELCEWAKNEDYLAISSTDRYSVRHNLFAKNHKMGNLQYINGCEFFCRLDSGHMVNEQWRADITRLDVLFVGFQITNELIDFVDFIYNDQAEIQKDFLRKDRGICQHPAEDMLNPAFFGQHLIEHKCLGDYVENLPLFDDVYYEFKKVGGGLIFNRLPFIEKTQKKYEIIQQLIDMDLWGLVSFRDTNSMQSNDIDINDGLEICSRTDLIPIVASGKHKDYGNRNMVGTEAKESFAWLSKQVLKSLSVLTIV